jgi:hypothetical protein
MTPQPHPHNRFERIFYFFPFQLLLLHLKRSHFFIIIWVLLFGMVTGFIGKKYGLLYLFLYPEYLGEVNYFSHAILGFSFGGFVMAYNMYSYVMHGYKFTFIATISRPFYKFSLNNFLIPAIFVIVYLISASTFQIDNELVSVPMVILNMFGFITGMFIFYVFSMYYFFKTSKDLSQLTGKSEEEMEKEYHAKNINTTLHRKIKWYEIFKTESGWKVTTYLNSPYKIKLARDSKHYDADVLKRVFSQTSINASIFEIAMIISFLLLGSLREYETFLIPAAASLVLLFTIIVMLISAIYSWMRGWTLSFIIALLFLLNYLSQHTALFAYKNFAYGLDYSNELAEYSVENIKFMANDTLTQQKDHLRTEGILNNWKSKNIHQPGAELNAKPKMIIICTSGGGIRSSLWTLHVLNHLDSATNGQFRQHTQLISGSSGGMLGAAYFRELCLMKEEKKIEEIHERKHLDKISSDLLNPVAFTIATNDIFIRYQTFTDGPYTYTKDRGYIFEKHFNKNTNFILDKRLYEYIIPEEEAKIPMLVIAPTITNDGRRLLISSQPISYLTNVSSTIGAPLESSYEFIEFRKMFAKQNALNLRFTSALRMGATFPYVMPMVSLPSEPQIEVMDAGIRDNYGIQIALKYIYEFKEWINKNTSGVIIIQIRDRQKEVAVLDSKNSVVKRLTRPAGNVLDNIFYTQDYENDQHLMYAKEWLGVDLEVLNFNLRKEIKKDNVSLSWHLTKLEKRIIINSINNPENKASLKKLKELLREH